MGRRTWYTTEKQLTAWLERQVEPVKWAIAIQKGRYEDDAWKEFRSIPDLPRGQKILMRPVNGKNGVYVKLDPLPAAERTALMSSLEADLTRKAAALDLRQRELDQRDRELVQREMEFLTYSRRSQMEIITIQTKQDQRTHSIVENLQAWEKAIQERMESAADMLKDIDEALQRAHDAEALNETAVSITYAADKLLGLAALWRVKKMEDIPPDLLKDFQEYLQDRASRRFFLHLPNGPRKWANTFMALTPELRNATMQQVTAALEEERQSKRANPPPAAAAAKPAPTVAPPAPAGAPSPPGDAGAAAAMPAAARPASLRRPPPKRGD